MIFRDHYFRRNTNKFIYCDNVIIIFGIMYFCTYDINSQSFFQSEWNFSCDASELKWCNTNWCDPKLCNLKRLWSKAIRSDAIRSEAIRLSDAMQSQAMRSEAIYLSRISEFVNSTSLVCRIWENKKSWIST